MTVIGAFFLFLFFSPKSLKDIWSTRKQNMPQVRRRKHGSHNLTFPCSSLQVPSPMLSLVAVDRKGFTSQTLVGGSNPWYLERGVESILMELRYPFYCLYFPILNSNCCCQKASGSERSRAVSGCRNRGELCRQTGEVAGCVERV